MAKLDKPLHSLRAHGRLTAQAVIRTVGRVPIFQKKPEPQDARSDKQVTWRAMYRMAIDLWHQLSPGEQAAWNLAARGMTMTGYAYFISCALKPNPGIYLPFAGGTMTGNIDMDGNRVLNLPAPVDPAEPARLADIGAPAAALPDGYMTRNGPAPEPALSCVPGVDLVNIATRAAVANFLCYEPMIVNTPIEIDEIMLAVSTGAVGVTVRMGIYTADIEWQPLALVIDAGTIDATDVGNKIITLAPALNLPAGRYLKTYVADGTPGLRVVRGNIPSHGCQLPSSTIPFFYRLRKSFALAALPVVVEKWDAWDNNNLPFEHAIRVRISNPAP